MTPRRRILTKGLTKTIYHRVDLKAQGYLKRAAETQKALSRDGEFQVEMTFVNLDDELSPLKARCLTRSKETAAWLLVQPCTLNGTHLSAKDF